MLGRKKMSLYEKFFIAIGALLLFTYSFTSQIVRASTSAEGRSAASSVTFDAPADFNGDGRTDYAVIRNNSGQLTWFWNVTQGGGFNVFQWGLIGDSVVMEDFDGDGKDDITVWRAGTGTSSAFFIFQSQTNTARIESFGLIGDDPTVVGDYDGDGKADLAVYRAGANPGQQSTWFYRGSLNNPTGSITFVPWGQNGDRPAPGDYDGDGRNDFVVKRDGGAQSVWWELHSNGSVTIDNFGLASDIIVPGDYDGDGKTDLAVVRNLGIGQLTWFIKPSTGGAIRQFGWGISGDSLVQGDYDGDGKTDPAIWRFGPPSVFWSLNSSDGSPKVFPFGSSTDSAVLQAFNRH